MLAGDLAEVRRTLMAGADPNLVIGKKRGRRESLRNVIPDGFTALHIAAYHDDAELCALLLERDVDLFAKTRFGTTPLELAVQWGSPSVVRLLVGAGVDPNRAGRLLTTAAGRGDLGMVELLLYLGARQDLGAALSSACSYRGSVEILVALITAGAEPATVGPTDWSARVVALDRRRFDCLKLLRESFRPHTLIDAVIDGDVAAVEERLNAGVKLDEPLRYDITALSCAARMGHLEIVQKLIAAGAALDDKTLWGTPIFCALVAGHLEVASDLHLRGAKLAGLHGRLLYARGSVEAVAWLCEKEPPEKPEVLLCTAIQIGDRAIVERLVSIGADPNGADAWGRRALTLAVFANRVDLVRLLLDQGADPKVRDTSGHPITHYVLTYDDVTDDWLDPDYDRKKYDRGSPALCTEAVRMILALGAPLPWDEPE